MRAMSWRRRQSSACAAAVLAMAVQVMFVLSLFQ
jgi:hypothetical protein